MKLKLKCAFFYEGLVRLAGETIDVDEDTAKELIEKGVAEEISVRPVPEGMRVRAESVAGTTVMVERVEFMPSHFVEEAEFARVHCIDESGRRIWFPIVSREGIEMLKAVAHYKLPARMKVEARTDLRGEKYFVLTSPR